LLIGDLIIKRCKELGIPQSFIYKKLGISNPGWYHMLKHNTFRFDTMIEISKILNVPITYWVDDPELPAPIGVRQVCEQPAPEYNLKARLLEMSRKLNALEVDVKEIKSGKKQKTR